MEEMIKVIADNGLGLVISGLFLWDWFVNKKQVNETLDVIKDVSSNIEKSLELLQKSMEKHDEKIDRVLEKLK